MTDTLAGWKYTDRVDKVRQAALASPGSFEEMVHFVSDDAWADKCTDGYMA